MKGRKSVAWSMLKYLMEKLTSKSQKRKVFALAIYGLVIFPRVLSHIDVGVIKLLDQMQ